MAGKFMKKLDKYDDANFDVILMTLEVTLEYPGIKHIICMAHF